MQNNSRNKASKRGGGKQGIASKNTRAITEIFREINFQSEAGLETELPENIHVGRVIRKLGNGRVEVNYSVRKQDTIEDNEGNVLEEVATCHIQQGQAIIRGSFRGKAKRSVWIEVNSIVVIEDSGLGIMEIKALMTREQLKDLSEEMKIHPQILSDQLGGGEKEDIGIEFINEEPDKRISSKEIDDI
jgi:hypothetical protein